MRLYYTEPSLKSFEAVVTAVEVVDGRTLVFLDRTAFYPTSGGQPFDTGSLATSRVLDVIDVDGRGIAHVVDSPLEPGMRVEGRIDWARRFDHMQQHTGQHVLSAAFERATGARTVSFHLGATTSTIDLDRDPGADGVAAAESLANEIVWENRPVHIRFAAPEEAARLPLRRETARSGRLRLIEVEGFDLSACGGTHVARTGEIGLIAVRRWERFKGGTRVEFVCGGRALGAFRELRESVAASVRLLSVLPRELPDAIARLQDEQKASARMQRDLLSRLAAAEASSLVSRAATIAGARVSIEALDGYDAQALRTMATTLASEPGRAAVLFSTGSPGLVVVSRSGDVALDASGLVRSLVARFGGKGGGRSDLAQGGGLTGDPTALVGAARELIEAALAGQARG